MTDAGSRPRDNQRQGASCRRSCQCRSISATRPGSRRLDAVSEQHEPLPGGPDCALELAGRAAEGVPVGARESAPLQELRKPTARLKWNATRFRVLGVLGENTDFARGKQRLFFVVRHAAIAFRLAN